MSKIHFILECYFLCAFFAIGNHMENIWESLILKSFSLSFSCFLSFFLFFFLSFFLSFSPSIYQFISFYSSFSYFQRCVCGWMPIISIINASLWLVGLIKDLYYEYIRIDMKVNQDKLFSINVTMFVLYGPRHGKI